MTLEEVQELEGSSSDEDDVPHKRSRQSFEPVPGSLVPSERHPCKTVECTGKRCCSSRSHFDLIHSLYMCMCCMSRCTVVPPGSAILKVAHPWIDLILDGVKLMEIRGTTTTKPAGTEGDPLAARQHSPLHVTHVMCASQCTYRKLARSKKGKHVSVSNQHL